MSEDKFIRKLEKDGENYSRILRIINDLEDKGYIKFNEDRSGIALTEKGLDEAKKLKMNKK